ncbi:tRNA (adenosine(37)-N6)-threonylcarbamoyltransferase complex dimerization subunit type 1 TsaB [Patiriisocius marinus]|uniref:N(6)-L-threonylcarbamoyladenine synthase n=1 Tax=Patiriisocius marinus TaxID=1397112 RepID=A0A5J4J1A9_9FLAO|nr:tRNA (adenosine(37)-N6)-threonylcarbamoyltransferase complex dimerization subunit type 1 TsaB [Patiriisocius marinus]GER58267.1 tRNA (adenosine(37)-N6)-threonylcarbamoyltransferase complex dimerization subunit type 1 TsaB [Patiriisocius marinus]
MATILCIETATTNCSVALSINGSVIALTEDNPLNEGGKKFSHAEKLHTYIDEVLGKAEISKHQLDAIAISKGPGSYTGLRIGVSAAKGLCYALDIPLISIPTLTSLAAQVNDAVTVIPMLDARRMEVYTATFDTARKQVTDTEAKIIDETSFNDTLEKGNVTFIGDGAAKFKEVCLHPNASFVLNALPSANEMAILAEAKYKISDIEDVAYFEPYYLKDFITG